MAGPGYLGYALTAGVQGFQTGMNLAQQKTERDWQKKQRKKLEEAEAKLKEEAALYNSVVTQAGADNFFSEDEIMKISTTYLALGYRTQESLKNAHNALLTMDKAAFDREMEYFNGTIELLKSGLLDPKDASAAFEYGRKNWAISDKVKSLYEAADNIYKKSHGEMVEEKTWERVGKLPSEVRVPFLKQEGVEMPEVAPETPSMADEKSAITLLKTFVRATPEQFEAQRKRIEQRTGLDLSIYTQDILREEGTEFFNLYDTPKEVLSKVKAPAGSGLMVVPSRDSKTGKYYATFQKKTTTLTPGGRVTSLPQQEKYSQQALDANTWTEAQGIVDKYAKAGYDTSEMPTEQDWTNGKLEELDSHVEMLREITDENGRLMGDKSFKFMSGDEVESKTGAEWYKYIYEAYIFYLEELKKMGIDVSKYRKIKSPGEVNKVGFLKGMFTGGGVERGYPSIYYTGTEPTPTETETEIPKLPSL